MRTDAKIGFAIGGVLLAVIIVYLLVVPRHRQGVNRHGVVLVTPSQPASPSAAPAPAPETTAGSESANADKTAQPAAPMNSSTPTAAPSDADKPAPGAVASTDARTGGSWDKLFPGSALMSTTPAGTGGAPAAATSGNSQSIAGTTPLAPAGETSLRSAGASTAGAALDGGASTAAASLNADRGADTGSTATPRQYVIKQGQTLSSIAADVYGNSRYYVSILKANPNINPNRLRPGTRIALPDISDVKPSGTASASAEEAISGANEPRSLDASGAAGGGVIVASEAAPPTEAVIASGRVYAVQKGDTLYRIAKRLYGSAAEAKVIYNMNQDVIGPNAAKLRLGTILHLPEGATSGT